MSGPVSLNPPPAIVAPAPPSVARATGGSGQTTTTTISSSSDWSRALLTLLGLPVTTTNVAALNAWQAAEGQWGASGAFNASQQHNPLNTEDPCAVAGAPCVGQKLCAGGACTWSYPDYTTGLQATAAYLRQPGMRPILSVLGSSGGIPALSAAVTQSGWGTGPFGGSSGTSQAAPDAQLVSYSPLLGNNPVGGPTIPLPKVNVTGAVLDVLGLKVSWSRIAMGAAGVALLIGGTAIFIASTEPGREAVTAGALLAA